MFVSIRIVVVVRQSGPKQDRIVVVGKRERRRKRIPVLLLEAARAVFGSANALSELILLREYYLYLGAG